MQKLILQLRDSVVEVLKENHALKELPGLISELADESRKLGLQQKVVVFSAVGLDKEARESLEAGLKKKLAKQIYFQYETNLEIKGGLIIKIGDKVYDYSLKRGVEELEKSIKA